MSLVYRPEIDGLRAVAVLPVIMFHAGIAGFSGGYVGVDVFFVISGFLITSLLLADLDSGKFSLLNFYTRRARRILPALYLVVLICIPFAWYWLLPTQFADFGKSVAAIGVFISNIEFYNLQGYFGPAAEEMPLLHTWSLSVEEQFYVVFPIVLFLLWQYKWRSVSITVPVLLACLLLSFAISDWASGARPSGNFYLIPTRAWELLVGALCAFALKSRNGASLNAVNSGAQDNIALKFGGVIAFAGIAMIGLAVFLFSEDTPFPSRYALLPVGGTALIILFASPGSVAGRLLALRPMVAIGLISYSAYLWHQPLLAFYRVQHIDEQVQVLIALIAAAFVLAFLTWRFVEKPMRSGQLSFFKTPRQVLTLSAAFSVLLVTVGVTINKSDGFRYRFDQLNQLGYEWDNRAIRKDSWSILRGMAGDERYRATSNAYDRIAEFDPEDNRENMLVVGNSHSKDFFNILNFSELAADKFELARFGAQIRRIAGQHDLYDSKLYEQADRIVLITEYSKNDIDTLPGVVDRMLEDEKQVILVTNMPEFPGKKHRTLADDIIIPILRNTDEDLTEPVAAQTAEMINRQYWYHIQMHDPFSEIDQKIRSAAQQAGVPVLDRRDSICDPDKQLCYAVSDNLTKYLYDQSHLSLPGARFSARLLDSTNWIDALE
ncbi:MAG: acyltransferase family protein [Pseudomonadota bacterium]